MLLKLNQLQLHLHSRFSTSIIHTNATKLDKITFFGSDLFSLKILTSLNELQKKNVFSKLNVVTCDNQNQQGSIIKQIKKNLVIDFCVKNKLDYYIWEKISAKNELKYEKLLNNHDLAVVASFAYLLPSKFIDLYK